MLLRRRQLGCALAFCLLAAAWASPARAQLTARFAHSTTLLPNGNILIVGGRAGDAGIYLDTVQMFISTADATVVRDNLNVPRASHTATLLPDGRVLVYGGRTTGGAALSSGEVYDPDTNVWTAYADIATSARYNHTANLLPNGLVLLAGGQDTTGPTILNTARLFNYQTNTYAATPDATMVLGRAGHTATLLHDGRVFFAGGYTNNAQSLFTLSTELYDPGSGDFAPGVNLMQQRTFHTATQMGNKKVLIVGGYHRRNVYENQGILETVEIYDPLADTIVPAKTMEGRKMLHSSVLLPDGRVSIGGGLGNITTSYVYISPLSVTNAAANLIRVNTPARPDGVVDPTTSITLQIVEMQLSKAVAGRVVNGDINFSSPTMSIPGVAKIDFNFSQILANTTKASLNGRGISAGMVKNQTVVLTAPGGAIHFEPIPTATVADDQVPAAQTATWATGNLTSDGQSADLNGSLALTLSIDGLPAPLVGATVTDGAAVLVGGGFGREGSDLQTGFDITLKGGSGDLDLAGCTFGSDGANGARLTCASDVNFTGLAGGGSKITCSSCSVGSPISSPLSIANLNITGLSVSLTYVATPIRALEQAFNFDVATVTIRHMIFGDDELYSPNTNTWGFGQAGASLYNHTAVLLPNADWALFGGKRCDDGTDCVSLLASTVPAVTIYVSEELWAEAGSLSIGRRNHTSTVLPNGNVLVAGGEGANDVLTDAMLYSITGSSWSTTGRLRQQRSHHTATLLPNGTVLVTGGFISAASTGSTRRSELYFPETGTWVETGMMVSSRAYHTATLLADGNVLVTGGYTNQNYIQTAEVYFSTSHRWVQVGDLNIARDRHTAALLRNGRVLIVGGFNAVNGVLDDVEIFNPATSSFDNTTPNNLIVGRHSHTGTTLADGRVLVTGGTDGFWEIGNAEIFDPVTNGWTRTDTQGLGPGPDMLKPRLNATAQLLPDNKVLYLGGYDALMGPIAVVESFDVAFTTWQVQGMLSPGRGDNTSVLLQNGYVMSIGGYDGLNFLGNASIHYFTARPDVNTSAIPSQRQPAIVAASTTSFNRGERLTITGRNFNGLTEASGGGGGSQNSHYQHPRVTLQRMDAAGNNAGNSGGFLSDLTREMITEELVSWQKMESSLTFTLPVAAGELPYGWYQLRVNANSQYSDSLSVQAAPRKPAGRTGTPVPTGLGVSSVAWRWDAAPGTDFDGYNVYSATSGVFLATVAVAGSACSVSPAVPAPCWIQGGLGPDTSALVKVAAYSMGGDGEVVFGTVPIHTYATTLGAVTGVARSTSSIDWTWDRNEAASWYDIMSASAGVRVGSSFTPDFTQTGLSTNTAVGIRVRVITDIGWGELTDPVTVYTRAAPPLEASPTIDKVSTGSLVAHWLPNTNPAGTTYTLEWRSEMGATWDSRAGITDVEAGLSGLNPNTRYDLKVTAVNGDGVDSDDYADLHSTVTWADTPKSPVVNYADTSNISINWDPNGNSTNTIHMITLSTNAYQTIYSTPVAWSDEYKVTYATFTTLLTGKTYEIRIFARHQYGRETAYVSTSAFTFNGEGAPEGSLGVLIDPTKVTSLSGTLAGEATRKVYIRVPPSAFDTATTIFLSAQTVPIGNPGCGTLDAAVTVTNPTGRQPRFPVDFGISYSGIAPGNLKTLGMVRWDPVGKTCVHLDSVVDVAGQMVIAKVNHFSDFQLQQVNPAANTVDTGIVFPNPMYTRNQGYITFDRFPASARVRIFTLHGEEVFEGLTNGMGILTWRVENKVGRPVASGLYLAVIEAKGDKKIHKLAVIR